MYNVPYEIKEKLHNDDAQINIRIHFPNGERSDICNDLIVSGSAKLTESLCSQNELKFGLCESPVFECETVGVGNIKDAAFDLTYEILCEPNVAGSVWKTDIQQFVFEIPMGKFIVQSCERQADLQHRKIMAYGGASATSWNLPDYEKSKAMYIFVDMASTYNMSSMTVDLSKIIQTKFDCAIKEELPFGSGGGVGRLYETENYLITFSSKTANIYLDSLIGKDLIVKAKYNTISSISDAWAKAVEMSKPYIDEMDYRTFEQVKKAFIESQLKPRITGTKYYPKNEECVYFNPLPDNRFFQYSIPYAINIKVTYKSGYVLSENEVPIIDIDSVKYYECESNLIPRPFVVTKSNLDEYFKYDLEKELMSVAELSGKIAKVERDKKLYLIDVKKAFYLKPSDDLLPSEQLKPLGVVGDSVSKSMYSDCWYDEAYTKPYGAVYCEYKDTKNQQQAVILYCEGYDKDTNITNYQIYDISSNDIIKNSLYTTAQITAIMQNIADAISNVTYVPVEAKTVALPYVECGDTLEVLTENNDSINTIVLRRVLSGESYVVDNFISK